VTTLSVNALAAPGEGLAELGCLDWILSCQHQNVHPFTGAAPGGWGWTDLSGGVPDADDTSGALLALAAFKSEVSEKQASRIDAAARPGVRWLLRLQNSDGGWPTFCRGWGKLPFDRSGVDLTAHALRALRAWQACVEPARAFQQVVERGLAFLASQQRPNGSWVPLWFGNQHRPDEENPVYGTARVLLAYRDFGLVDSDPARRAIDWLASQQNPDGGWGFKPSDLGGPSRPASSVEETAVALEALVSTPIDPSHGPIVARGIDWLVAAVESGRHWQSSPIGFYFAKLWYYEKLYPVAFTASTLGQALRRFQIESNLPASRHKHH
jgi:squalene-hopene/tetraprenyl-beta-curcumene cyclase